jgi:hypothetical protein
MAADAGHARHPAVLDLVPDPRLCVDRHPQEGRTAQPVPDEHGPYQRAADDHEHVDGGLHRYRILVPAVHDPAALCQPRKDQPGAARSSRGSRLAAMEGVLAGHIPAVASWRACGLLPRLHSGDGRIRDPGSARRVGYAHDRQDAVGRVLLQPRLAGVLGGRRGAAARPRDPDRAVPAQPGKAGEAAR